MGFLWPLSSLYALLVFLATPVIAIPPQPILRHANGPFKPGFEQQAVSAHNRPSLSCVLVDICASVDIGLVAELGPIIGLDTLESVLTKSRLCLCIKDLKNFLNTDNDMVILTNIAGRDTLKDFLEVLIKTSPNRKECSRDNITHTYGADPCTCTHSLCSRHYDVKSSTVSSSTSHSLAQATTEHEQGEQGETAAPAEVSADSYTECLLSSKCDDWAGNSCYHIPNAKETSFIEGRCVINACNSGWFPSTRRDACIRVPRALSVRRRRSQARGSGNDGVTLDFHIVIDLTRIMRVLSNLHTHTSDLRKNSTLANTSVILVSTDKIVQVGTKVILSRSVSSLLSCTAELFNLAQQADAKQSDCALGGNLVLDLIKLDVTALVDLTADILYWYQFPADGHMSSDPNVSDIPITVSLSQLFDALGLGSVENTIKVSGPGHDVSGPLGVHSIGSGGERRGLIGSPDINSLLEQVEKLINFVFQLERLSSLLPSDAEDSEKLATLTPVSLSVLGLATSTNVSELSSSLDFLVLASSNARMTFSRCGDCGTFVDELSLVVKTAIAIKASCENFPWSQEIKFPFSISALEFGSPSAPDVHASTMDTSPQPKGTPVVIGLNGLLHRLGLSGVSADMTIDGLDADLSGTLNEVSSWLHARTRKMTQGDDDFFSVIFSDPGLAKAFMIVVEAGINLESKLAGPGPIASLLAGLLPPVLVLLQAVLGSQTVTGLVPVIDNLLGSAKEMDTLLTGCNCATALLLESSGIFVTAVMDIQSRINEHIERR